MGRRAAALGAPLLAFPEVGFVHMEDHLIHRLLRHRATLLKKPPPLLPPLTRDDYLHASTFYTHRFRHVPDALHETGRFARKTATTLPHSGWVLPAPPLPSGMNEATALRREVFAGLGKRYATLSTPILRRAERELTLISRMGFAGYFLVTHELVRFLRRQGTPSLGRGSGAGSLVAYALFLTHVDPMAHKLYFERFLNPERRNPPDLDLDVPWDERDAALGHLRDRYGEDHMAMVGTHVTYSLRSGFREAALALGIPRREVDRACRLLPHSRLHTLMDLWEARPESRVLPLNRPPFSTAFLLAKRLYGLPRHRSVHCGGAILAPFPLAQRVALEPAPRGFPITQGDMFDVEALGLVKLDILGNRSLGVVRDARGWVEAEGVSLQPLDSPEALDRDPDTAQALRQGDTVGCFYVESPGMRNLLPKLGVDTYPELVAATSIIRPGVSESGMMQAYIRRHLGEEKARYLLPELKPLLGETHGIMIYQEDVLRVVHEVVGLSLGQADLLRRAMSGKYRSRQEMDTLEKAFFDASKDRGIPSPVAHELWRQIRSFAGYAFCKAHSASFSHLSLQAVYLKSHHPAAFMAAVLRNHGGFYSAAAYVEEARRMGLTILPPCVNEATPEWEPVGKTAIQPGFSQIRGLRVVDRDLLLSERKNRGSFPSLAALWLRMGTRLRPEAWASLAASGALDTFGSRESVLKTLMERYPDMKPPSDLSSMISRLQEERRVLRFCVTAHPLAPWWPIAGAVPAHTLATVPTHQVARCWGLVRTYKRVGTRRGPMAFATLEDPTGLAELTLFPQAFRQYGLLLKTGRPIFVRGVLDTDHGARTLTVDRAALWMANLRPGRQGREAL